MSQPPPIVEFQHATKRFGDGPPVISALSLAARPGDFISLVGPSGCGKSTLLRLIAGLTPLTEGSLHLGGTPLASTTPDADLAFVFQDPVLLPWLTVRANVEMLLRLRRVPAAQRRERSLRMLDLVGLAAFAGQYPRQLSGGQKMRVSLARALTVRPSLLLLDEPFGALDEMTRDRLNEELLALREHRPWTAFFVTHSVAEAVFLSNRIIVLAANPGRIAREIPVDLPFPRTAETRLSPAYLQLVATVSRILRSVDTAASSPPSASAA